MRVFYGLELPQNVLDACAALSDRASAKAAGRYSLKENYHITLAFVGEVGKEDIATLAAIGRDVAGRFAPPLLTLGGAAYFKRIHKALLYCALSKDDSLAPVHESLISQLDAQDLPCEKGGFHPHITLARNADLTALALGTLPTYEDVSFVCPQLTLFLSARDAANVLKYTAIERFPFNLFTNA